MTTEEERFAAVQREIAQCKRARDAAPKFWIVFVTTRDYHDHALFQTHEEAEAALIEHITENYLREGAAPPADWEDAYHRFYAAGPRGSRDCTENISFNILEAPIGFWTESV
jgi:hypothetical protein